MRIRVPLGSVPLPDRDVVGLLKDIKVLAMVMIDNDDIYPIISITMNGYLPLFDRYVLCTLTRHLCYMDRFEIASTLTSTFP